MTCPICDQKARNCDCSESEKRLHSELEEANSRCAELEEELANAKLEHNSSEEKPLPCPYCKVIPEVRFDHDFWECEVTRPMLTSCFICTAHTCGPIPDFNRMMEKILELRRQDYLAGFYNGALKSFDDYIARKDDE